MFDGRQRQRFPDRAALLVIAALFLLIFLAGPGIATRTLALNNPPATTTTTTTTTTATPTTTTTTTTTTTDTTTTTGTTTTDTTTTTTDTTTTTTDTTTTGPPTSPPPFPCVCNFAESSWTPDLAPLGQSVTPSFGFAGSNVATNEVVSVIYYSPEQTVAYVTYFSYADGSLSSAVTFDNLCNGQFNPTELSYFAFCDTDGCTNTVQDKDGNIFTFGYTNFNYPSITLCILKVLPNKTIDTSFGLGGYKKVVLADNYSVMQIFAPPSGSSDPFIYFALVQNPGFHSNAVTRFSSATEDIDTTYGTSGYSSYTWNNPPFSLSYQYTQYGAFQSSGNLVSMNYASQNSPFMSGGFAARLLNANNGMLDPSFGPGGSGGTIGILVQSGSNVGSNYVYPDDRISFPAVSVNGQPSMAVSSDSSAILFAVNEMTDVIPGQNGGYLSLQYRPKNFCTGITGTLFQVDNATDLYQAIVLSDYYGNPVTPGPSLSPYNVIGYSSLPYYAYNFERLADGNIYVYGYNSLRRLSC